MALIKCKECGKEISSQAPSCPHCGAPGRPQPAPAPKTSPLTMGCATIIGLAVAIGFIGQWNADRLKNNQAKAEAERLAQLSPQERVKEFTRKSAEASAKAEADAKRTEHTGTVYACRQFIEKSLKDPDSIEYVDLADATYFEKKKNGDLFAQVQARAKNSFNAKILTVFDCTVSRSGDNWRLKSLKEH